MDRHQTRAMRRGAGTFHVVGAFALAACEVRVNLGALSAFDTDDEESSAASTDTAPGAPTSSEADTSGSSGSTAVTTDTTTDEPTTAPYCPEGGGTGDISFPVSCAEVLLGAPGAMDGAYTLYAGNDPARPWPAWCEDMIGTPREYLSLSMTGEGFNFSEYVPGIFPGTVVRTTYSRVRIDPRCFMVDIGDQTFSTSTGQLMHDGAVVVTSMPYAVAMDCVAPASKSGHANIDLRGTPFTVPLEQFVAEGNFVGSGLSASSNDQVFDIFGGGYCGDMRPSLPDYAFAQPFNSWGGFYLQVLYTL